MKKLLYITNIPAPYRQKRFNLMQEIFPKYGIQFEVLYMAQIEPNRKWAIPQESFRYNYSIYKGIHPVIGRFYAHFNPGLLLRLLKNDYDVAIVGGMASPTHWFAPFFIRGNKIQVMSIESNLNSVERKTGIGARIKKILLQKADAYQVTGTPQKHYIEYFYPEASRMKYITLPNIIDEEVFRDQVSLLKYNKSSLRKEFKVSEEMQMWVLPARLNMIKGIIPFLNLIEGIQNIHLFILGDGEQKLEIQDLIINKCLPATLVGFVQQEQVVKYYAAADLFVLPSIKDPSPLTPIEALASGLPLLVSSRIGNVEDVVEENENGWSYDPVIESPTGRLLVKEISALNRLQLSDMGNSSLKIYSRKFDSTTLIKNYANQLNQLLNGQ